MDWIELNQYADIVSNMKIRNENESSLARKYDFGLNFDTESALATLAWVDDELNVATVISEFAKSAPIPLSTGIVVVKDNLRSSANHINFACARIKD